MGDKQQPSTTETVLGAIADVGGAVNNFDIPGLSDAGNLVNGIFGTGKEMAADEGSLWGLIGSIGNGLSGAADMVGSEMAPWFGGIGNIGGIGGGISDAMDPDKSYGDRFIGGLDAFGNAASLAGGVVEGLGLAAGVEGFSVAAMGGLEASALLSGGTSAGGLLTAGGAGAALGSAGAIAGAGVAGWKIGGMINDINNSDYARSSLFGQNESGENRTAYEAVQDGALSVGDTIEDWTGNETAGLIAGGTTAAVGSLLAAGMGVSTAIGNGAESMGSGIAEFLGAEEGGTASNVAGGLGRAATYYFNPLGAAMDGISAVGSLFAD